MGETRKCGHGEERARCESCVRRAKDEGAWGLAERVCVEHLEKLYGSKEAGMLEVGRRTFEKWVGRVEEAIESENPE